jgi:hypothetical protein
MWAALGALVMLPLFLGLVWLLSKLLSPFVSESSNRIYVAISLAWIVAGIGSAGLASYVFPKLGIRPQVIGLPPDCPPQLYFNPDKYELGRDPLLEQEALPTIDGCPKPLW